MTSLSNFLIFILSPRKTLKKNIFKKGDSTLLEIPVTTLPVSRLPIHFIYGASFGKFYLSHAINWTRRFSIPMSYLFHLIDYSGSLDSRYKSYQWGVLSPVKKENLIEPLIVKLNKHYRLLRLEDFVNEFERSQNQIQ